MKKYDEFFQGNIIKDTNNNLYLNENSYKILTCLNDELFIRYLEVISIHRVVSIGTVLDSDLKSIIINIIFWDTSYTTLRYSVENCTQVEKTLKTIIDNVINIINQQVSVYLKESKNRQIERLINEYVREELEGEKIY